MDFDFKGLRDALGCFPTGIAVMTVAPAAEAAKPIKAAEAAKPIKAAEAANPTGQDVSHIGITVNSFTSVSLDPPLVLWCIDRRSRRYPHFARAPGFTVSILASGHRAVSARLAGAGEHSLDGIALIPTELGPPALADSLAVFECARESVQDAGDHAILIGRVLRFFLHDSAGAPLVYFRGRYGALAQGVSGRRAGDGE